ncbi:MAG: hypothetical protein AB7V25_07575 [Mangrovibacterium sp.]
MNGDTLLFDLTTDPAERNNVMKDNPAIVKKMISEYQDFLRFNAET